MNNLLSINSLTLAYIGDSVYEVYIRNYLVNSGIIKVNNLQKEAVKYVSAKGQCKIVTSMLDNNFLTEEEFEVFKRARNYKTTSHPKNTDIITYKYATGFEAVIGYLYLKKDIKRLEELFEYCIRGD